MTIEITLFLLVLCYLVTVELRLSALDRYVKANNRVNTTQAELNILETKAFLELKQKVELIIVENAMRKDKEN